MGSPNNDILLVVCIFFNIEKFWSLHLIKTRFFAWIVIVFLENYFKFQKLLEITQTKNMLEVDFMLQLQKLAKQNVWFVLNFVLLGLLFQIWKVSYFNEKFTFILWFCQNFLRYEFFLDPSQHKCYLKGHGNICFNQLNYKALNPIAISGYLCSNKNGTKCWSTTGQIHESCYYESLNKVVLETSEDLTGKVSVMG